MGGITNETVHLSFAVDWSKEVNPLLYVCKCTAKRVRLDHKRVVADSDYYLRGQDFGKELLDNLMVGKSIDVDDSLSLVPVSVSVRNEYAPYIVVYVEKTKGRMCISKVEDSHGPNFRAPVY